MTLQALRCTVPLMLISLTRACCLLLFTMLLPVMDGRANEAPETANPVDARGESGPSKPVDFDAFWDKQLARLESIPVDARVISGDAGTPKIVYEKFSLAVTESGRVQGQMAFPKDGKTFPALVIFQWAGFYALQKETVIGRAQSGWLAVNVMAHDLPIDESPDFYQKIEATLKGYGDVGWDESELSPFLRMFLATRRVLDFVKGLPNWDGRVLVVHGTSLGGAQALVAAALDPDVSAVVAHVPAFCDLTATSEPHPYWRKRARELGLDEAAAATAAARFDIVNFAPRIKAPVFVSAGLNDATCPAKGIETMVSQLSGPKELMLLPGANHKGEGGTHQPALDRMKVWLAALQKSQPVPSSHP